MVTATAERTHISPSQTQVKDVPLLELKLSIYHPKQIGPLPLSLLSPICDLINSSFNVPDNNRHFSRSRISEGPRQLQEEISKGVLFIWTSLNDDMVATVTVKPWGGGWTKVPSWVGLHSDIPTFDKVGQPIITAQGNKLAAQLEQGTSLALYELALFCVSPAWKSHGVGSFVLQEVEKFVRLVGASGDVDSAAREFVGGAAPDLNPSNEGRETGKEIGMLVAFVIPTIGRNAVFYQKRGFETVSITHHDRGFWGCFLDEDFDLCAMVKEIYRH